MSADVTEENVSTVDISSALAKSEIYAAIYKDGSWSTKKITENNEADMAPAVSANNGHAVVVWQKVAPSADDPMNAVAKNELWYSVYDNGDWGEAAMLDSGDAGNVKSFSAAVASDGSAMVVANIDTDRDDATTGDMDVFTYYISNGSVTRKNLTNNELLDGSPKVTARKIGDKEYFLTAWYSEQVEVKDNGQVDEEVGETIALLSSEIKLSVWGIDGEKVDRFPSSFGSGTGDFNFIKSNDTTLNSVGILWSQVSEDNNSASQTLYARLLTPGDDSSITVTSPYAVTSVNPYDEFTASGEEIVKFDAVAKKVGNDINIEAVYLKNSLEFDDEDGVMVIKTTSTDLMSASKLITEGIDLGDPEYDATGVHSGTILPLTIPVHNIGLSKVNSLKVNANGQVYNIDRSILPDETLEVTIDYLVEEPIRDITIEVTPVYASPDADKKANVEVAINKLDLGVKSVVLSGTGDGGRRIFDVNLKNEGTKPIAGSGYRVQITVYEDFARTIPAAIEDLSSGETITYGNITIADEGKLADIDAKSGTCKIGYTVLTDAYDDNGNKTLYIDADIIDSFGNIVDEASYADNQGGIAFTSPKLIYPSQFEVSVIQENEDGVTKADVTVRNLYPEAGKDALRLRLLNNNAVIEEKNIPVDLDAESSMSDTVTFTKTGTGIQTVFLGDLTPGPSYPSDSDSSSGSGQTPAENKPADKKG